MAVEDAEKVVEWRNNPKNRVWFFDQKEFTVEQHLKWFASRPENRYDCVFCDRNYHPIGTLNFISEGNGEAEAGRLLGEVEYRGRGLAKEALCAWLKYGFEDLGFDYIYGNTKVQNLPNINLNIRIGYFIESLLNQEGDSEELYYRMILTKQRFYLLNNV